MGEVARVDSIIDYIVLTAGYVLWHIAGVILSTGLLLPPHTSSSCSDYILSASSTAIQASHSL